jgi:hypothetical protein
VTRSGLAALVLAEASMRERLDDVLARVDDRAALRQSLAQLEAALDQRRDERRAERTRR